MVLKEKINSDLAAALKSGDGFMVDTLRFLISGIHNREIEKRSKTGEIILTDEEILEVLSREAKKRKEATLAFQKGGREELAKKETKELEIIKTYLPPELSEEEIKKVISETIRKTGIKDEKDSGRLMGEAMKQLKGRTDSSVVSRLIRELLGQK